jgi:hypothetical protein
MAKVEQKVGLDPSDYTKNLNKLQRTNQQEMKRVNKEFEQSGDVIDDFTQGSKKDLAQLSSAFGDLFEGLTDKIKGLNLGKLAAIGAAITGAAKAQAALDRTNATAEGIGFQANLSQFDTQGLKSELLDASSAANVDFQEVADAAREAIGRGGNVGESVGFAETAAKLSRLSDELDPRTTAEFIAENLKGRDEEITQKNARAVADAIAVATRNGFKDAAEAVSVISEFDPVALKEAGLSNRELVNILGGLRTGSGVGRDASTSLLKELIAIQRGPIGQAEALAGITGLNVRGQDGQLQLRRQDFEQLNARLKQVGDVRLRRDLLQGTGLSEQGADALLKIAQDPSGFFQGQQAAARDTGNLDQAFERATNTFTEKLSSGWNTFLNSLEKPLFVIDTETGEIGQATTSFKSKGPGVNQIMEQAASGSRPSWLQKQPDTATDPSGEKEVKVTFDVGTVEPGYTARPKATDQFRNPGGF